MKSNFLLIPPVIQRLMIGSLLSFLILFSAQSQNCNIIPIDGTMFYNADGSQATGNQWANALGDEQSLIGTPVAGQNNGQVNTTWQYPWTSNSQSYIELPQTYDLQTIWIYDGWGSGVFTVAEGLPSDGNAPIVTFTTSEGQGYIHEFDISGLQTQYLTFTRQTTSAKVVEIALCAATGNQTCDPTLSSTNLNVDENAGSSNVTVNGISAGWTVSSSNTSWLNASNQNDSNIDISYTANTGPNARTATITLTCTNGVSSPPITITQDGTGGGNCSIISINPSMFFKPDGTQANNGAEWGQALGDEQSDLGTPVAGETNGDLTTTWQYPWEADAQTYLALPQSYNLEKIWIVDGWGTGNFTVAEGLPSEGNPPIVSLSTSEGQGYVHEFDISGVQAQYLTFTKMSTSAKVVEIGLCGTTGNNPLCTPSLSPSSLNLNSPANSSNINVSGISNGWTATSSNTNWLNVSNSNSSITANYTENTGTNPRTATITITCANSSTATPILVTQAGSGSICSGWTNATAGQNILASDINYNPNDPTTFTFQRDNPSPYTIGEMLGISVKSTYMDNVYNVNNNTLRPNASDDYITQLSKHVRSFHYMEKDYDSGVEPTDGTGIPTKISGLSSLMERYESWKTIWSNQGIDDITIIAALELAQPVNGLPTSPYLAFPFKWWAPSQWGTDQADIYQNAKTYGKAFAEASCPNLSDCFVDVLEAGNEPWQYPDPNDYQAIIKGVVDGVKEYFEDNGITDPDLWPMKVMPGAFQAFREEGVVSPVNNSSLYDHIGTRVPCEYGDYLHGISVHPYSFTAVNIYEDWKTKIFDLVAHPEDPESQFQFVKNAVYWRNVNLPAKETGSPDEYKTKVYVTEFGWDSGLGDPNSSIPQVGEIAQSLYLIRGVLMMSRLSVYQTTIYEAWDDVLQGSQYNSSGLFAPDANDVPNIPKRSYDAVKNFRDQLVDQRFLEALHDGDAVNGANLYSYVMGQDGSTTPEFLVVWDGKAVADAQSSSAVNALRSDLTNLSNKPEVSIDISSIVAQNLTVNASGAEWLHDQAGALYGSNNISVNGNTLTLKASPVPVLIPLTNGQPPNGDDIIVTITPDQNPITEGQLFTVALKIKNNTSQTINNINANCLGLNYNHTSGSNNAFTLQNSGSLNESHGNYNWWTAQWAIGSLNAGEEATINFEFRTRVPGECTPAISLAVTATENGSNYTESTTVNCASNFTSGTSNLQNSDYYIYVYPNPADKEVTLRINSKHQKTGTIYITDEAGNTIQKFGHALNEGINELQLDVSNLMPGVHYISIDDFKDPVRFVKVKM